MIAHAKYWPLILLMMTTTGAVAADFHATGIIQDLFQAERGDFSWSRPQSWTGPNGDGPKTAADVGHIGDGHALSTGDSLGKPDDRPIIQIDKGGLLWITRETNQPIRLNGGTIRPTWNDGRFVRGPIEVTEDSTLFAYDDYTYGGHLHLASKVSNTKPVTLSIHGDVRWEGDSSKTCSATMRVEFGSLFVANGDSSTLGSGDIVLLPSTRFEFLRGGDHRLYRLVNNVTGDGTVQVEGDDHRNALSPIGITLHPGQPHKTGTLVMYGSLKFDRGSDGAFDKLIIEVNGPGDTADHDYSQLVSRGPLLDTLDNVDLILQINSALSADEVKKYVLNILDAKQTDISGFKPFHSVTVRHGDQTGKAKITFHADDSGTGGMVTVSDLSMP